MRAWRAIISLCLAITCACTSSPPERPPEAHLVEIKEEAFVEPRYYCTEMNRGTCVLVRLQSTDVTLALTRELCQEGSIDACIDLGSLRPVMRGPEWYTHIRGYCERGHSRSCHVLSNAFTSFDQYTLEDLHLAQAWRHKASKQSGDPTSSWFWTYGVWRRHETIKSLAELGYLHGITIRALNHEDSPDPGTCSHEEQELFPYRCTRVLDEDANHLSRLKLVDPLATHIDEMQRCERQSDVFACMRLASMYSVSSRFIEEDALRARHYYRRMCNEGMLEGCFELAQTYREEVPDQLDVRFEIYREIEEFAPDSDVEKLARMLEDGHPEERTWAARVLEEMCVDGQSKVTCESRRSGKHHEYDTLSTSVDEMQRALRQAARLDGIYEPSAEQEVWFETCSIENRSACVEVLQFYLHERPQDLSDVMNWVTDRSCVHGGYCINFSFGALIGVVDLKVPDEVLLDHLLPYCDSVDQYREEYEVIACGFIGERVLTSTDRRYRSVALDMMRHACFGQEYDGCVRVAKLFVNNDYGIPADPDEYDLWMLRACRMEAWEQNCMDPAMTYMKGDATHAPDLPRARHYLTGACRVGYVDACLFLADGVDHGLWDAPPDEPQRFAWIERACLLGRSAGCERLVHIFRRDDTGPARRTRIRDALKFACRRGNDEACRFFSPETK